MRKRLRLMIGQAYIDALATCLMEGAEDPAKPAHARMCELIRADVSIFHHIPCTCTYVLMPFYPIVDSKTQANSGLPR